MKLFLRECSVPKSMIQSWGQDETPRWRSGLQVIELSDRAMPRLVGRNSAVARASSVAIAGGNIFVTTEGLEEGDGLTSLGMLPFFRSISRTGSELHLSWEGWGKARIEGTPSLSNPDWRDLLIPETTNDGVISSDSGNQFFRLIRP